MTKIRVFYEDTDASGRVYHSNYLKFFERGRTELIYQTNYTHKNLLNEFDIIVGKSFYVLIILITISLLFIAYILNFFIKKLTYFESLLISTTAYWVFFKHNSLNLFFQKINIDDT